MISVIIPTYNAGTALARAVDSVWNQTFRDFEIIVVDDGSQDDTRALAESYADRITYIYQEKSGVSVARNRGMESARYEWFAFLDADDAFLPHKLETQLALLNEHPSLKWCAGNYNISDGQLFSPKTKPARVKQALCGRDYFSDYFLLEGPMRSLYTSTIMIHRELYEELGGFEPGRRRAQDLDLWWRIAHRYPQIGYCPEPVSTVHLEVRENVLTERRKQSKRGVDVRELVARHLQLAEQEGSLTRFRHYAARELRSRLLQMIFNGFYEDATATIDEFRDLFPQHWRMATHLVCRFPRVTTNAMHNGALLLHKLGLDRTASRRWLHREDRFKIY